ncbi:MAG: LysE family transporter [Myxococcaceae bacterium]|nr:LysE family transporter [Myxococcaceae bacterium]
MATAGLVAVGAVTPGPNNLVVMRAAARSGLAGALPAILGIVLGGLALLAVVAAGGAALFDLVPRSRWAVTFVGCLYLAWLGGALVVSSFRVTGADGSTGPAEQSGGAAALFGFQFLNPKSWVMALTATSAVQASGSVAGFVQLAALFVLIPTVCLLAWSSLGALLTSALRRPDVRAWFDRAMGCLLFASALLLLLEA